MQRANLRARESAGSREISTRLYYCVTAEAQAAVDVTPEQEKLWARPQLEDAGPIRNAAGFFRTAEGGGSALGGVPLVAAEDAVVAAVRMA